MEGIKISSMNTPGTPFSFTEGGISISSIDESSSLDIGDCRSRSLRNSGAYKNQY